MKHFELALSFHFGERRKEATGRLAENLAKLKCDQYFYLLRLGQGSGEVHETARALKELVPTFDVPDVMRRKKLEEIKMYGGEDLEEVKMYGFDECDLLFNVAETPEVALEAAAALGIEEKELYKYVLGWEGDEGGGPRRS